MPSTKERVKELQKYYRHVKALAVRQYLLEHPCKDCGEADIVVLDFDHVTGKKRTNISRMLNGSYSMASIFAEIAKCEVRCSNCHRRATAKRGNFYQYMDTVPVKPAFLSAKKKDWHGTSNGYGYHKCRCSQCTEAQRIHCKKYRSKNIALA